MPDTTCRKQMIMLVLNPLSQDINMVWKMPYLVVSNKNLITL